MAARGLPPATIGAAALLAWMQWPAPNHLLNFPVLMGCAQRLRITLRRSSATVALEPPFVIQFASLLLLGAHAATLIACAGIVMQRLTKRRQPTRLVLVRIAGATTALQGAGFVYRAVGGVTGDLSWPTQAFPIAVAMLVYSLVAIVITAVAEPIACAQPIAPSWWREIVAGCEAHVVGAFVAAGWGMLIDRQAWALVLISAVPTFFAWRIYRTHIHHLLDDEHGRAVANALDQCMCVLDDEGHITTWSDAAERVLECPRERAIGATLISAVKALEKTEIPKAISEAQSTQSTRVLRDVVVHTTPSRIVEMRIVPVAGGVTLLWHDVTERAQVKRSLKRHEERLALAAQGANDGLWEWDLRTHEFYFSTRWMLMLGLSGPARIGRPEEWLKRVHADDIGAVNDALEAYLSARANTCVMSTGSFITTGRIAVSFCAASRYAAPVAGRYTSPDP